MADHLESLRETRANAVEMVHRFFDALERPEPPGHELRLEVRMDGMVYEVRGPAPVDPAQLRIPDVYARQRVGSFTTTPNPYLPGTEAAEAWRRESMAEVPPPERCPSEFVGGEAGAGGWEGRRYRCVLPAGHPFGEHRHRLVPEEEPQVVVMPADPMDHPHTMPASEAPDGASLPSATPDPEET